MKFEDTYNFGLSGWIWQKHPNQLDVEPNIDFPQLSPYAESNHITKINEIQKEGYNLVTWGFRSTFMFPYKYQKFPFNVRNIELKMTYPDYSKRILFTPDIEGYQSIVPSDLPGITSDIESNSKYLSTKFLIGKHQVPVDLDSESIRKLQSIQTLQYEIKSRKPFLNALVKQFIPIFLVSLMIYLLLFNL